MLKDKIIRRVFYIALAIVVLGVIIFAALIPINWYLICGWLYGSIVATIGFLMNVYLITVFFNAVKTKGKGIFLGLTKFFFQIFFHTVFLIILILINTWWKQNQIFKLSKLDDLVNPINLFTYLGAIGIFTISTILVNIPILNVKESEVTNG